jgi:2-iminobutanoate/2-iminopropanoate deaminase
VISRTQGQVPGLPGAVRAGDIIVTSGIVAPSTLRTTDAIPAERQIGEAVGALKEALEDAGASIHDVVRIEAFIASPEVMGAWNEVFAEIWGETPPARTTLVSGFARDNILFEVQALAIQTEN